MVDRADSSTPRGLGESEFHAMIEAELGFKGWAKECSGVVVLESWLVLFGSQAAPPTKRVPEARLSFRGLVGILSRVIRAVNYVLHNAGEAVRSEIRDRLPPRFDLLESWLESSTPGDRYSVDISHRHVDNAEGLTGACLVVEIVATGCIDDGINPKSSSSCYYREVSDTPGVAYESHGKGADLEIEIALEHASQMWQEVDLELEEVAVEFLDVLGQSGPWDETTAAVSRRVSTLIEACVASRDEREEESHLSIVALHKTAPFPRLYRLQVECLERCGLKLDKVSEPSLHSNN